MIDTLLDVLFFMYRIYLTTYYNYNIEKEKVNKQKKLQDTNQRDNINLSSPMAHENEKDKR